MVQFGSVEDKCYSFQKHHQTHALHAAVQMESFTTLPIFSFFFQNLF